MNYELFIARRIIANKKHKSSISSPIIKIAVLAIALGTVIMLISVSVASGFQQKIRDKIAGFKGHITITNYDNNYSDVSVVPINKNQEFYPEFKNLNGIKNVQIFANKAGIIRTKENFEGIILKGISSDYNLSFFKEYLQKGRLPNFNLKRNREIIISNILATRLNLKLNDTIQTLFSVEESNIPFKLRKNVIVGIFDTGFQQFDRNIVVGDIREVQKLNQWNDNKIGGFEVVIKNFDDLKKINNSIYKQIGTTLNSNSIIDNYPAIFEWIQLFDNNVWFIISFVLIIAIINMTTALLVIILERVQMIGILKALGATNKSIRKIFLYNASSLVLKGLMWGNIIGIGLLLLQKYGKVISLNPKTYYVTTVPIGLDIKVIALLNAGTLIFCFVMLIIPSAIITKIKPSKSIKFE